MDYYSEKLVSAIIIILGSLVLIIIILFGLKLTFLNLQEQEQVDLKGNLIHYFSFDCCKEPIRNSVLFYKCDNEPLKNILIDEDNRSIYDYDIKQGCEIIE